MSSWVEQVDDLEGFVAFLAAHNLTAPELDDTEYVLSLYDNYIEYKG